MAAMISQMTLAPPQRSIAAPPIMVATMKLIEPHRRKRP
jgi:hypothetical protein